MRTLALLLLLVAPAQATTYSFLTNQTTSVYVTGDIPNPVGVMFNLTPLAPMSTCLTLCDFAIYGNAYIENGNWLYGDLSVSIDQFTPMYIPGRFILDDEHRWLTISSRIGWYDTFPETISPRITFNLPDGLALGFPAFALAVAETPLPAAWPLFASGLVLLLWRRRRQ